MKTLALEDIYADPHKLDAYLESGEAVEVMRAGRAIAELIPRQATEKLDRVGKRPDTDYHARFLEMWGAEALSSSISVADEFAELRSERAL